MTKYSHPAKLQVDRVLFPRPTKGLGRLQKQSRKEMRQKGREEYWNEKQRRENES